MILNKLVSRIKLYKPINVCTLCSKTIEDLCEDECSDQTTTNNQEEITKNKIKKRPIGKRLMKEIDEFFISNPHIFKYRDFIPPKFFTCSNVSRPFHMYLICPEIAKKVASYILATVNNNRHQIVAETNAGLAFITNELLKQGVPRVRLYETSLDFKHIIEHNYGDFQERLELFNKDLFKLQLYSHVDRYDQGNRGASLLTGFPTKSWIDEPVMTVVGAMTDMSFIRYLIKSIVLQREIAIYGRIDIFAIIFPNDWAILNSTNEDNLYNYKPWSILFRIFFEAKFLDSFPRKFFVPWPKRTTKKGGHFRNFDKDNVYLIKISMRKHICLNAEDFVPFFCFIQTFLGSSANKTIISVCEKWVPGCGLNLILPKLNHDDYFEDLNIFTKFRELSPYQIVAVFKEIASLPQYQGSPFMDMVEQELMKSETISSDIHETHKYKRKVVESDIIA